VNRISSRRIVPPRSRATAVAPWRAAARTADRQHGRANRIERGTPARARKGRGDGASSDQTFARWQAESRFACVPAIREAAVAPSVRAADDGGIRHPPCHQVGHAIRLVTKRPTRPVTRSAAYGHRSTPGRISFPISRPAEGGERFRRTEPVTVIPDAQRTRPLDQQLNLQSHSTRPRRGAAPSPCPPSQPRLPIHRSRFAAKRFSTRSISRSSDGDRPRFESDQQNRPRGIPGHRVN
jgi:hypothetical protein